MAYMSFILRNIFFYIIETSPRPNAHPFPCLGEGKEILIPNRRLDVKEKQMR